MKFELERESTVRHADGLLAVQLGASTKLRTAGFRQRMASRLAVGLAGPYWGANERYHLSAADFISYTDAELPEAKTAKISGDQTPPPPPRFDEWVARVRRQLDVWCLVYGRGVADSEDVSFGLAVSVAPRLPPLVAVGEYHGLVGVVVVAIHGRLQGDPPEAKEGDWTGNLDAPRAEVSCTPPHSRWTGLAADAQYL